MSPQRFRVTYSHMPAADSAGGLAGRWADSVDAAGLLLAPPTGGRRMRIELGPPLPAGCVGERELVDIWLAQSIDAKEVCERLARTASPALRPLDVEEIGDRLPSLTASVRKLRYRAVFAPGGINGEVVKSRISWLYAQASLEREEVRGERVRLVDVRALVAELVVGVDGAESYVEMCVLMDRQRTVRPSTVLEVLELPEAPVRITRTLIEVERTRMALRAWRERGRFE